MSWLIVKRAFIILFGNIKEALIASVPPLVIAIILSSLILSVGRVNFVDLGNMAADAVDPVSVLFATFVVIAIYLFASSVIAVVWHRFVLLEETPQLMPPLKGMPVSSYLWAAVGRVLLLIAVAVPLFAGLAMIVTNIFGAATLFAGMAISIFAGTVLSFLWFRIGLGLPGIALGKPMSIGQSWRKTEPIQGVIFQVAVILVCINIGLTILVAPLSSMSPIITIPVNIALNWVTLMVGVCILTTFYGHVVEGRDLD